MMSVNKFLFTFFIIAIGIKYSFTQDYGYAIGTNFSAWEIENSSITIKISENKLLEKIVYYFYVKDFIENFENSEFQKIYEDIEKISKIGFGNREIIRLILIQKKVPLTTKSLVPIAELCLKRGSVKVVAERFGLNYEDIWLESNKIFEQITKQED